MNVEALVPESRQSLQPPLPDPLGGDGHVGSPQGVVPGYPGIQPELGAGLEADGPSPAAAPGQLGVPPPQGASHRRAPPAACCRARAWAGRPHGPGRPAGVRDEIVRRRKEIARRSTSGGGSEIRRPQRIDVGEMAQPPQVPVGRGWLHPECPPQLGEQLIGLDQVVALAGGDDVEPIVGTPPARGITWSIVSAGCEQYTQRPPSRRSTERRVTGGVRAQRGMRTICESRTIDGTSILSLAEWKTLQSSRTATASARPASIRTTARRSETRASGS